MRITVSSELTLISRPNSLIHLNIFLFTILAGYVPSSIYPMPMIQIRCNKFKYLKYSLKEGSANSSKKLKLKHFLNFVRLGFNSGPRVVLKIYVPLA